MCGLFCLSSRLPTRATFSLDIFASDGAPPDGPVVRMVLPLSAIICLLLPFSAAPPMRPGGSYRGSTSRRGVIIAGAVRGL